MKQKLLVCVGSSCHLKGSYFVLQRLKELIADNKLDDKLELSASFCLGKCAEGVSMKLGQDYILNGSPENIDEVFAAEILPKIK